MRKPARGGRKGSVKDHREIALEAPIGRALWTLGWPIFVANELFTAALLVMAFWIGRLLGEQGLAVDTLFRPVGLLGQMTVNLTSLGGSVLVARSVGAADQRGAMIAANTMTLTVAIWAAIALLIAPFARPVAGLIAGDLPLDGPMMDYLIAWLFAALPAAGIAEVMGDVIMATGWTRVAMVRTLLDLAFITVLLPVFISVFDFGIAGAQLCMGIGGTVLIIVLVQALRQRSHELALGRLPDKPLRPDWAVWREILRIGLPVQLSRMLHLGMQIVMIQIVARESGAAVAGYGVSVLLILVVCEFTNALSQAARTLIGQSLGAGKLDRAKRVPAAALKLGFVWSALMLAILNIGEPLIGIVTSDPAVKHDGARALGIMCWGMFGVGVWQVLLNSFAAYKNTGHASLLATASDGVGLVFALLWTGDSWLDAACYAFLVGNYVKAAALAILGLRVLRNPTLPPPVRGDPGASTP